jgi:hypothetical protein
MNDYICKICKNEFASEAGLHKHIKAHNLRLIEYYQVHYPRYDMFSGEIILFKNKSQYLSSDFNSRDNLRRWIETRPREEVEHYIKTILINRKQKKNIKYTLSQVELRSLMMPPISIYNKYFGDYYKFCESLGFENKYSLPPPKIVSKQIFGKIYIDTREQKPLTFPGQFTETKTLKFGDYAFSDKPASCDAYIERKSISDFIGTLSGGLNRFSNEIQRSIDAKTKLIILVETSLSNALRFNELCHVYQKNTKATPEFIFYNVRDIIQKYPSIQFLFVRDRIEASRIVRRIFTCECIYDKIDLQFAYDSGIL